MRNKNLNIVIAGGGSTYTPGIIQAMIDSRTNFDFSQITLYDIDEVRNDDMFQIIHYMLEKENLQEQVRLRQTAIPEEAFMKADFVFSQIRVGGMKMREIDEKIPLKHGIVGQETCGLGGFSFGLRSISGLLEIVSYVEKYAPEAWILNYTNPETLISEAIRRQYPNIKMLNACDMTISIEETIADNFGYDRKNWIPIYYGLNHFGWYQSIYDKSIDRDILPEILDKLDEFGLKIADFNAGDQTWQSAWDMLCLISKEFPGYLPNNYLEYYLYPDIVVEHSDPNYTRANMVMDGREKNTKEMAAKIRRKESGEILNFNFGAHGQYIVDMAVSILNDNHDRFMLIMPNMGAIPNLRHDAVVEIPAYVGRTGAEPISLRFEINDFHKGLMEAQNAAEKLLVDGYFEHSYQKVLQAFTLNQTVPSARVAKAVLDEFIIANGDLWPALK
ncbi:MAG: maltose-6'-phosphate glucosidase [Enterococcaceae bacterium]|jgi:maltose-6'-phosphate glucosidase|nr:maltose-6'-phosphate glucosidase [Enterococcaceae bacterium]